MSAIGLMPNRPHFLPQSPKGAFFVFFLGIFLAIAAFVVLISWLDVNEAIAVALGAAFSLLLALFFLGYIKQPLGRLAHAATEWSDELEERIQDLKSEHSQAQAILESMIEGVCALGRDGTVLWINRSAESLFGLTPQEAKGKRLTELIRQPELGAMISEALEGKQPSVREVRFLGPLEQTVHVQVTPCGAEQGQTSLVVVAQDVTDMRKLESMRRDFVANVSHELKTPLTSIKGLVETLLSGALEDPANNRRFVVLIDEDTTRLTRLIDDLLDLSQIESKALPLRLQPVALRPFFEQLEARFKNQLEAQQVVWDLTIPTGVPSVEADPDRLRQIFVNLIDNAIKFNKPNGRVTISADPDASWVRITVADTGAGIPEGDLPRIFERFYRVDKARSRELGGTGLGLAIVKHLVELHRGRIDIASRLGEGSAFTVSLRAHS